ncbi:serine hydrolase [Nonomuraea sp. NN258]|uniref:serine hydrolase domain-containing protein n=1 Tax=Nonomuraea antri TaxID=2730852 RepID=UPI0015688FB1|nr:serine hydrolase [Nonomuraea antri]NRQ30318.1 serine hydrolase [Nonomuraea antri]
MTLDERIERVVTEGRAPGLHGLVVRRGGTTVLERYESGDDAMLGHAIGHVTFDRDTLHDLRSVTKSVVGILYGIALGKGLVPEPGAPLLAQFPEYPDLAADPARGRLTVEHVLTMTLGLDWNEDAPYTSVANSEIAMEAAPDRYRFILERPIVEEPGRRWTYCGGASALLGAIVARGTGQSLTAYAEQALFGPLGITDFQWLKGDDGIESAAAGLRLRPVDVAAIGQLMLDGGRDIVPATWVADSTRPRADIEGEFRYGYQWYVDRRWFEAIGNGGQRLVVVPDEELVVVVTAGEYDQGQTSAAAVLATVLNP